MARTIDTAADAVLKRQARGGTIMSDGVRPWKKPESLFSAVEDTGVIEGPITDARTKTEADSSEAPR